jgi:hypothetical protein
MTCNNFLPKKYASQFFLTANSISNVTTRIAAPAKEKRTYGDMQ